MSDKRTPDEKKAGDSRSAGSGDKSPSPLAANSFTLAAGDSRTSNLQFGAIGGPTTPVGTTRPQPGFVLSAPNAQVPFRHATSLANLSASASSANPRTLRSNQPGNSYVTGLATWRRGPGEAAPLPAAPRGEVRGQGRPETRPAAPAETRDDRLARATEYQEREMKKYQEKLEQQQKDQPGQLVRYRPREPFRPMNAKLNPEAANRPLTEEQKAYRQRKNISEAYLGDAENPANASADIPGGLNCSVWITRLPPDCTYADLLGAIAVHHPGKVFVSFISPPKQPQNEREAKLPSTGHSAAKVVFYQPMAAQRLIILATRRQFFVRGYMANAVPNKIKVAPQPDDNDTSRCLRIQGPANLVDVEELRRLFRNYFEWDEEAVVVVNEWTDYYRAREGVPWRHLEWRFACYRAQAMSAHKCIHDYCPGVMVWYVPDPCDVQVPVVPMQQMQIGQAGQHWQ